MAPGGDILVAVLVEGNLPGRPPPGTPLTPGPPAGSAPLAEAKVASDSPSRNTRAACVIVNQDRSRWSSRIVTRVSVVAPQPASRAVGDGKPMTPEPAFPTMGCMAIPDAAEQRVWARLPPGSRPALQDLSPTDLQTLLISLARDRASAVTPAQVLRRRRADRFVQPATSDPRLLAATELRLWGCLPADVDGVELSPVVPLGTCAAVAPVSQNRIVTTARTSEVVSDSTNALAVEAALRRQHLPPEVDVHLATCQRQLRAQQFGPGAGAHFRLFAVVSSGRDTGSGRTEARLLLRHLRFWRHALGRLAPSASFRIGVTAWDREPLAERLRDTVLPALAHDDSADTRQVEVTEDPHRQRGRGYYTSGAIMITTRGRGGHIELGDGGLTTWTAQFLGNAKERCLVSCLSTERLTDLIQQAAARPGTNPSAPSLTASRRGRT
jgi:hypothetical protein